jgi:hypothetical protein
MGMAVLRIQTALSRHYELVELHLSGTEFQHRSQSLGFDRWTSSRLSPNGFKHHLAGSIGIGLH